MLGKVWSLAPWKTAWRTGPSLHQHFRHSLNFQPPPAGTGSSAAGYNAGGAKWSTGSRAWSQLATNNAPGTSDGSPGLRSDDDTDERDRVLRLRSSPANPIRFHSSARNFHSLSSSVATVQQSLPLNDDLPPPNSSSENRQQVSTSSTPSHWSEPSKHSIFYQHRILESLQTGDPRQVQYQISEYQKSDQSHHSHQTNDIALLALLQTHAPAGDIKQALAIYFDLVAANIPIPASTLSLFIRIFCARQEAARDIRNQIQQMNEINSLSESAKPWNYEWALLSQPRLNEMEASSSQSFQSINKLEKEAHQLFSEDYYPAAKKIFLSLGINQMELDTLTYDALLAEAANRPDQLDFGLQVFAAQERSSSEHSKPSPNSYISLIQLYVQAKDIEGARLVFEAYNKARSSGQFKDFVSPPSPNRWLGKDGEILLSMNIIPTETRDQEVWNTMISAEMSVGDPAKALDLVESMSSTIPLDVTNSSTLSPSTPISPSLTTSSIQRIIIGFVAAGDWKTAQRWFDKFLLSQPRGNVEDAETEHLPAAPYDFYLVLLENILIPRRPSGAAEDGTKDDLHVVVPFANHVFKKFVQNGFLSDNVKIEQRDKLLSVCESLLDLNISYTLTTDSDDGEPQHLMNLINTIENSSYDMWNLFKFDQARRLIHAISLKIDNQEAANVLLRLYRNLSNENNIGSFTERATLRSLVYSLPFSVSGLQIPPPPNFAPRMNHESITKIISEESNNKYIFTEKNLPYDMFSKLVSVVAVLFDRQILHPGLAVALRNNYTTPSASSSRTREEWTTIILATFMIETLGGTRAPDINNATVLEDIVSDMEKTGSDYQDVLDSSDNLFMGGINVRDTFAQVIDFYGNKLAKRFKDVVLNYKIVTELPEAVPVASETVAENGAPLTPSQNDTSTPTPLLTRSSSPYKLSLSSEASRRNQTISHTDVIKIDEIYGKNPDGALRILKSAASRNLVVPTRLASQLIDSYARRVRANVNSGTNTRQEEMEWLYAYGYSCLNDEPLASLRWEEWKKLENMMIMAYSSLGLADRVNVHRNRLFAHGVAPSADAYGTMIAKSQDTTDDASVALGLFTEARQLGVALNTYIYNTLISKLTRARRTSLAMSYFAEMKEMGRPCAPSTITYGTVINACCRIGDLATAEDLFKEMVGRWRYKPSVPPYNTMIQGFVSAMNREKAVQYYDELLNAKLRPSSHTYKLLMDAYGTITPQDMDSVEAVFGTLLADLNVLVSSDHFASLINGYGTVGGNVDKAIEVFEELSTNPEQFRVATNNMPDAIVYEALFNALVTHGRFDLVDKYRERQERDHVRMTAYVANCLIRGYASAGRIEEARNLFESMGDPERGIAAPFNHPKLSSYGDTGEVMMEVVNTQPWQNVYREPSTYEAMITAEMEHGEQGNAIELLERLKARGFPVPIVNSMSKLIYSNNNNSGDNNGQ